MKTFIFVLIAVAFIESTFLPLDLVLITLICRSFLKADKANLYLAFGFGLVVSHLKLLPLGLQSILFLALVQITGNLSKSRLSSNAFLIIPICFVAILINQIMVAIFTYQPLELLPKIYGAFLSLPVFYLIRFWEERFVVRKEIRLRV